MHGAIGTMELQDTSRPIMGAVRHWYALLVASGMERKVCIWLRRRQYEPYWPRYKGQVKLNRHRRAIQWRSVIPGYLFIPAPEHGSVNWSLVESAPGVHGFMCSAGNIVSLPEIGKQGIEQIMAIETALNESAIAAVHGIPFKKGQLVFVKSLEIIGEIKRIDGRDRIMVEVPMFGSKVPMWLSSGAIDAA
jgi:transcription antitermination factor NusG